jgi:DNA replication protein DnaC
VGWPHSGNPPDSGRRYPRGVGSDPPGPSRNSCVEQHPTTTHPHRHQPRCRHTARLRYARFPFRKTIGEFDFEFQPSIDRKLVDDVATLRFMETGRPILFLGQPGCGKTHLAIAIATLAVESGVRGCFTNAEDMVTNIAQAIREGNLASKLKTYTAPSILVIDDVGLLPMDRAAASAFYQIVNQRYEKQHSTIVTTNRSLPDWGEIFGDTVVASAILDRLMHNAVVFNIKGPSWRLREHQALTIATTERRTN